MSTDTPTAYLKFKKNEHGRKILYQFFITEPNTDVNTIEPALIYNDDCQEGEWREVTLEE